MNVKLVKVKNGVIEKYPYNIQDLFNEHPNISFPKDMNPIFFEQLDHLGVFRVVEVPPPQYNKVLNNIVENNPQLIDGRWIQEWIIAPLNQEQVDAKKALMRLDYDGYLSFHFDTVASSKGYSSRISCMVRAGFPGPYQQEALAFAQWVDEATVAGYSIIENALSNNMDLPEYNDFVSLLPPFTWPS